MTSLSDGALVALVGIVSMSVFAATLRNLSHGVIALVLSVPVQDEFALQISGHHATWTKVMLAATVAAWIVRMSVGASRPKVDALSIAFSGYVLALTVSIANARDLSAWAGETYRWVVALVVYLMARDAFSSTANIHTFVIAVSAAVTAVAAVAAWQIATDAGPATFSVDGLTRVYATFGEPNPFAGYLEMTILLLIAVIAGRAARVRFWRWQSWLPLQSTIFVMVAVVAGTGALVATQSRGGFVGFAAGVGVVIWLTGGRVRLLGIVGGGICVLLVLLSPLGASVRDRFRAESLSAGPTQVTVDNWAAQERAAHWRAAIAMAESSPFTGIGAGNYNDRYREETTVWRFRIPRGHAHNAYLQALAQAGLVGSLAYLSIIGVVGWEITKALKRQVDGVGRSVIIGVAAVTAAVAVHNLVEYLHVLSLGIQLSIVWAAIKVIPANSETELTRSSPVVALR